MYMQEGKQKMNYFVMNRIFSTEIAPSGNNDRKVRGGMHNHLHLEPINKKERLTTGR